MPGGDPDPEGDAPSRLGVWQRLLLALPRLRSGRDKPPLGERLRGAVLKPADPDAAPGAKQPDVPASVEELEASVKAADDKERLIGLLAAPIAAIIAITVISALISKDPAQYLKNGQVNKQYVSLSLYHSLTLVLLGLSVLMLAAAWFRKRMFLGMVMALYGLAIFNLHWWGFGIPFILGAAWLLVRAYRLQRDLREATAGGPGSRGRGGPNPAPPRPNKRYTPPTAQPKRPPTPKRDGEQRAG
jgi:hypothetical protein